MSESEKPESGDESVVSIGTVEAAVAVLLLLIAGLVIYDSNRVGFRWAAEGPESGYFPFHIGVIIAISSTVILVRALVSKDAGGKAFVQRTRFRAVLSVLVPTAVFIGTTYLLGIYAASALFIAAFMRWFGRFSWARIAAVSLPVPFILFLMFEVWFLVPLPKGPLEALLGY